MATQIKRKTINIPNEILEEILYNLPVKSLLRFKCVSKRWRSLITGKQFIKRHLKKSNTNPDIPHHTIIFRLSHMFLQQNAPVEPLEYPLRSLLYGPITTFNNRPRQTSHASRMWGSCDGLRLMTVDAIHLFLFNPSTLKYRRVQQGEFGRRSGRFIYGLGYDESTDDYKVVSINIQSNLEPCRTRIYSSRTGSWKEIEDFDKCFPVDDSGKFVNGRLHWLGRNHDIVALDLVEEKYEIMARPESYSSSFPYQPILGDLGGYLSLNGHRLMLESDVPMLDTSVWVMTKYGVRESWTKIWTLSDFADPKNHIRGAIPLFLSKNGDIAVALGSSVVVYNGKNKVHESRGAILNDIIESVVYVESLVSPFGDEELGRC